MIRMLFSVLLLAACARAQHWEGIGPDDLDVNHYLSSFTGDVLCTGDGLTIGFGEEWESWSYGGLPVWQAADLDAERLLLVQGDGSDSDGVYTFDRLSHEFEVQLWLLYPKFLFWDGMEYWAGGAEGLFRSSDGAVWDAVPHFAGYDCLAMAAWGPHYVVAAEISIHVSDDQGATWVEVPQGTPWISDMAFDFEGKLYGIFPDWSWSSGLWSSLDFGWWWEVEFWDPGMSAVHIVDDQVYVSWIDFSGFWEGVARWSPEAGELVSINGDLPWLRVNELCENTIIDCLNLVACTEQGAYITCDLFDYPRPEVRIEYSNGFIVLSWEPLPGATEYVVYSSASPREGFSEDLSGVFVGTSWIAPVAGPQRFYRMTAVY